MVSECKPEWNREAIMVFSRLPSLRRLQATPLLQTSLKKGLKELCLVLRRFSEDRPPIRFLNPAGLVHQYYPGLNMGDSSFFKLVFCDLKRLQYFWPYLPNKNPVFISDKFSTLHILAKLGHVETFQFIAERLDEVIPYRSMKVKDQLEIASRNRNFGMVLIIFKLQNPI